MHTFQGMYSSPILIILTYSFKEQQLMNEHTGTHEVTNQSDQPRQLEGMVWIPGGTFLMGSDHHYPEEAPVHEVSVDGFWMDKYTVTNEQFRRFVEATAYVTIAERPLNTDNYPGALPELLVPGSVVFQQPPHRVDLHDTNNWWAYIPGANWKHPEGP